MTDGERLVAIETTVNHIKEAITEHALDVKETHIDIKRVLDKHDKRITMNERFRHILTGGVLVVSGGGAVVWKYLTGGN